MSSWLFIPGTNHKALKKISSLDAHKIIIDLEDAVPLEEKSSARMDVQQVLKEAGRKCLVRINDCHSGLWEEDVKVVICENLEGIVLPKVESDKEIVALADVIHREEIKHNLKKDSVKIYPLIESAKGVMNAQSIAAAHPRVARLLFGAIDYSLDANVTITQHGSELLYARSHLVLSSRVANILPPVDTVFIDMEDDEGLEKETLRVKELGFKGKLVIHPRQISTVNTIFHTTSEEITRAEEIIEIFTKNGYNAVKLNGLMIDKPVYIQALKVVESKKK